MSCFPNLFTWIPFQKTSITFTVPKLYSYLSPCLLHNSLGFLGDDTNPMGKHCSSVIIFSSISFTLVFNWNHFEMRLLNLKINFYILRTFCPHLGSFCGVSSFTTFRPNLNHLKKARGEMWPKRSERRNNTKNYQDEDTKSAINKN